MQESFRIQCKAWYYHFQGQVAQLAHIVQLTNTIFARTQLSELTANIPKINQPVGTYSHFEDADITSMYRRSEVASDVISSVDVARSHAYRVANLTIAAQVSFAGSLQYLGETPQRRVALLG